MNKAWQFGYLGELLEEVQREHLCNGALMKHKITVNVETTKNGLFGKKKVIEKTLTMTLQAMAATEDEINSEMEACGI